MVRCAAGGKVRRANGLARGYGTRRWSDDYAEALKQPRMPQRPRTLPENQDLAYGIGQKRQRSEVTKTPVARFLRHRFNSPPPGYRHHHIVRSSTNIGVESTARNAREQGFNLIIIAEDARSAASSEQHQSSMTHISRALAGYAA